MSLHGRRYWKIEEGIASGQVATNHLWKTIFQTQNNQTFFQTNFFSKKYFLFCYFHNFFQKKSNAHLSHIHLHKDFFTHHFCDAPHSQTFSTPTIFCTIFFLTNVTCVFFTFEHNMFQRIFFTRNLFLFSTTFFSWFSCSRENIWFFIL